MGHKAEKTLDTFASVYRKDYKFYDCYQRRKQPRRFDPYELSPRDAAEFTSIKKKPPSKSDMAFVKTFYASRMRTTYRTDYTYDCEGLSDSSSDIFKPENDTLITEAAALYGEQPRLPLLPLVSSLRVMPGPPRYYYTGISEYKDTVSKGGFFWLKVNFDKGIPRLGLVRPITPTEGHSSQQTSNLSAKNKSL